MQDGEHGNAVAPTAPFDREDWLKRLRALNPWADGFELDGGSSEFEAARKAASLERWRAGREVWNAWASAMLALKNEAKRAQVWGAGRGKLAQSYSEFSEATFTGHVFSADADFHSFFFPGVARFSRASFAGSADFSLSDFIDRAWFSATKFNCEANFSHTTFYSPPWFDGSKFFGVARFAEARFPEPTWFNRATFADAAWFDGAHFDSRVAFDGATFGGASSFREVVFGVTSGNGRRSGVSFCQATFIGPITFAEAKFRSRAKFTSIHSKVAFSLARAIFATTPDFIEATFHHAPRLDDSNLTPPICVSHPLSHCEETATASFPVDPRPPGLLRCFALARDEHEHARLRKLRAMAADGKDHENELIFNAYEIAARRFWVDKPWPPTKVGRFWLGWLYGLISDTGRSIARPLAAWAITILIFWCVFFFFTTDREVHHHDGGCHADYRATLLSSEVAAAERRALTGPLGEALMLAIRNATVIDRTDPASLRRMYGCLYGMTGNGAGALPVVPPSVTLLSGLQSIISAALLFLTVLGVRNMFRLK